MVAAPIPPANKKDPLPQDMLSLLNPMPLINMLQQHGGLSLLDPRPLGNYLWDTSGLADPATAGHPVPHDARDLLASVGHGVTSLIDKITGGDVTDTYKEKPTDPSGFGAEPYAEYKGKVMNPELLRGRRALDKSEGDVAKLEGKPPPEQKAEPVDLSGTKWQPGGGPGMLSRAGSSLGHLLAPAPAPRPSISSPSPYQQMPPNVQNNIDPATKQLLMRMMGVQQ